MFLEIRSIPSSISPHVVATVEAVGLDMNPCGVNWDIESKK